MPYNNSRTDNQVLLLLNPGRYTFYMTYGKIKPSINDIPNSLISVS